MEENMRFGKSLVRISAKNRENTVLNRALVRIRANIEKTPFVVKL